MKGPIGRADLEAAIAAADLRVLLMCLFHLTGDEVWLSPTFKPSRDTRLIPDPRAGMSEEAQAAVRAAAVEILADGVPEPVVDVPSEDLFRRMMGQCLGEEVPPAYVPMMYADFGFASEAVEAGAAPSAAPSVDLDVAIVGAGVSGICLAAKLEKRGVPYTVFERNAEVGGTWFTNRYPGCGVDTPNHFYSYSFRPNPGWGFYFSPRSEIQDYLERCATEFGIRQHLRFESDVRSARWDESEQRWHLSVVTPGGSDTCTARVLVLATGHFSRPHGVDFPGLDEYEGQVLHTAEWPAEADLAGLRVGVVGTGASAMQTVPSIVDEVASLTIFQRTPQWCRPEQTYKTPVEPVSRWLFEELPFYTKWYRFSEFWRFGDGLLRFLRRDPEWPHPQRSINRGNERHRLELLEYLAGELEGRPDLIAKCTPAYPPFGKRMLIDNGWFAALRRPDVELVTDAIARFEPDGIRDSAGRLHSLDAVILATGFDIVDIPAVIEIRGRQGGSLAEDWADANPTAYLGMAVPGFPNMFVMFGPNTNMGHGGSGMWLAETQSQFITRCIGEMAAGGIVAMEATEEARTAYTEEVDRRHEHLIWSHPGVETYYKNPRGQVRSPMPYRLVDYWALTSELDLSRFHLTPIGEGAKVPT